MAQTVSTLFYCHIHIPLRRPLDATHTVIHQRTPRGSHEQNHITCATVLDHRSIKGINQRSYCYIHIVYCLRKENRVLTSDRKHKKHICSDSTNRRTYYDRRQESLDRSIKGINQRSYCYIHMGKLSFIVCVKKIVCCRPFDP